MMNRQTRNRGSFTNLLKEYPEVDRYIQSHVCEWRKLKMSFRAIHLKVLILLKEQGCKDNEYPFCAASGGYDALRRYVRKLETHMSRPLRARRKREER